MFYKVILDRFHISIKTGRGTHIINQIDFRFIERFAADLTRFHIIIILRKNHTQIRKKRVFKSISFQQYKCSIYIPLEYGDLRGHLR
jgi:hypothetical protein